MKNNNKSWGRVLGSLLLTLFFFVGAQSVSAQGTRISGVVNDDMGPVMLANVVERDNNNRIVNATTTDMNGNFAMTIKSPKNKLVVSFVGNKTQVLNIGTTKMFKIFMPSETQLQEVVVKAKKTSNVGGLSIPQREVAVAMQTFKMEDVEGLSFTSADEALQGEIAGLDIVSNSGNLGSGTQMRLRGVNTINGDANPLIVVDDKIFDNPDESFDFQNASEEQYASLLSVNVDDIANIAVLKDAAATAVWGINGANGVIQITTKRGARGKTRVNLSYKLKGTWMPAGYKLLNGDDYTMMMKEEFYNPTQSATATTNIAELNYDRAWPEYENWNNNTDWVNAVSQFGLQHNVNLNITGGGKMANFYISGSYDHQTGSIIKQTMDRFTTRLALDYFVSDRITFSPTFALTYTSNERNYIDNLLGNAQQLAPNMSVYRQDMYGNDTDDYYLMNPTTQGKTPYDGSYNSYELRAVRALGNPVAMANLAWRNESTYRITPDFRLKYDVLGKDADNHRLTLEGIVDFDIFSSSSPKFTPAGLTTNQWTDVNTNYNQSYTSESNRFRIGAKFKATFIPHFKNEDWSGQIMAQYEMFQQSGNSQGITLYNLPNGMTSTNIQGAYTSMFSSTSRRNGENMLFNGHISYKGKYNLSASLRVDGDSRLGPNQKWVLSPGVSLRYNLSDEPWMNFLEKAKISILSLRASWGINGKPPTKDYLFYNSYSTSAGYYGAGTTGVVPFATLSGLKLDDLRPEKTTSWNFGGNINFFDDKLSIDFDYYRKTTKDLFMNTVVIPSYTGFGSLATANVGTMTNNGWELNISGRDFVKAGKFSLSASVNFAQNANNLEKMDERVLDAINTEWVATSRGVTLNRVQVNNPLGSIYGFRYQGVYNYSYAWLETQNKQNAQNNPNWTSADYESMINGMLAKGINLPVVVDANGKVVMTNQGSPQRLVYNYKDGNSTYMFQGGDAKYEDVNHDGQINALDIVYLGNSMPKLQGGFSLTLKYGRWKLVGRFNFRVGNKIYNAARMNLENMFTTNNQSAAVNYRWRKEGDGVSSTVLPRAMFNTGYNWQGSDRYVEDGSFLRFQNLQLSYSFDQKLVKKWGLSSLSIYASMDNVCVFTKYSGVDPEVSYGSWGVATDNSKTPRTRQFTASVTVGF